MQNAKDTFYEMLRTRVAANNPDRTAVVRGSVRPAVLVSENELPDVIAPLDCFCLEWPAVDVDADQPAPLVTMQCAVHYATEGTAINAGMDRGRSLSTMDAELIAAISATPMHAVKQNFAPLVSGGAVTAMGSQIWWSDVTFETAKLVSDELRRTAHVTVWSYEEAGEVG